MHLIEHYALSCGVKISKPHIEPLFFPVSAKKYITFHTPNEIQSKTYDFYNDVLELIHPFLKDKDIEIVQLGENAEDSLPHCINYQGKTTIRQSAFIIKNSLLHVGADSVFTHIASGMNKKTVGLYSNFFKECTAPYWGSIKKHKQLEPDRSKLKPCFSKNEWPKTINTILPESISCAILDLLNIKHNLHNIETIHIGSDYHNGSLSIIPNHTMPKDFAKGQPANILANEYFNEENIVRWAQSRTVNLFLDKPMSINYLRLIKNNINQINYHIKPTDNDSFFKSARRLGINCKLICEDPDVINNLRMKFFDWEVYLINKKTKKDIDNYNKICNNSRYKSSQIIASENKLYTSKTAWKHNKEGNYDKIIDCEEFWEESSNLKIYNDNNGAT